MKTALALSALVPLGLLALSACVDNDEEITVRPDGSVAVVIAAKGKPADLADGYPVPLGGPWIATNDATLEWMRVLGSDTGSALVRANLADLDGQSSKTSTIQPDQESTLQVRAEFFSVKALPRFFAPESEAYRSAYLERSTDLEVERKGGRTVYVFERTYHGRTFERLDALSLVKANLDEKLFAKVEHDGELDDGERAKVVQAAVLAMRRVAEGFAGDALLSVYTQGDASIAPPSSERIRAAVRAAIERVVTPDRLARIVTGVFPPQGQPKSDDAEEDLARMEKEVRETLRSTFAQGLESERAPAATQNALRGELEWLFTARDHTEDLGDDSFKVHVRLPGTIVGGNYDKMDDGAATWEFNGQGLRDRDRVLRVVSVVE